MKTCSHDCLQILDVPENAIDNKTIIVLSETQAIHSNPSDTPPYDINIDSHLVQERSDQFFGEDTTITDSVTGSEVGHVFTSKVTIGGNDKWTEEWVFNDDATLIAAVTGSAVKHSFRYTDSGNNSATYITALQSTPTGSTAVSMSVDFYYEKFAMNQSPVKDLPKGIPGSLNQVTFKVYSLKLAGNVVISKTHTGWLFRLHKQTPAGLLHADHWVLYSGYELPSQADMATELEETSPTPSGFNSAWHFCEYADTNRPAGQTPQWFVRTQAIYESV